MITSTLRTLVVVPELYSCLSREGTPAAQAAAAQAAAAQAAAAQAGGAGTGPLMPEGMPADKG